MDTHRSAAERMRPILEAMQRSVESARRKRLYGSDQPPTSSSAHTAASHTTPSDLPASQSPAAQPSNNIDQSENPQTGASETPQRSVPPGDGQTSAGSGRLKARPKRFSSTFLPPSQSPPYRSQAS